MIKVSNREKKQSQALSPFMKFNNKFGSSYMSSTKSGGRRTLPSKLNSTGFSSQPSQPSSKGSPNKMIPFRSDQSPGIDGGPIGLRKVNSYENQYRSSLNDEKTKRLLKKFTFKII